MNTLGRLFRVSVVGESHGLLVGALVDGVPPGVEFSTDDVQPQLDRRRPGQNLLATQRQEDDRVEFLSGVLEGRTTGAPVLMIIRNQDARSRDYAGLVEVPRPGHSDYTARVKFKGFNDPRGGGMFSGRMTAALVMAGALARKILGPTNVDLAAHATVIGGVRASGGFDVARIRANVDKTPVRCADLDAAKRMEEAILTARSAKDSVGGVVECVCEGVPAGLGEPMADSLESLLSHALFAIPAVKAVEFGDGFAFADRRGSEVSDPYAAGPSGGVRTLANHNGGILGGITTGMPIVFRVAFKPTSSIAVPQPTLNLRTGETERLEVRGRHDPCIVPRAVPVVEAAAWIALADAWMLNRGVVG